MKIKEIKNIFMILIVLEYYFMKLKKYEIDF